ncbi:family 2 glycosyl transferase [Sphaerisporangium aureirubrum]|uniref:Family 2 glycosyl transferase n=1 Tax=Sphaerisporangium aureirubrum TaxID=1544736 RepID=A0ABW1NFY4_9ACTN
MAEGDPTPLGYARTPSVGTADLAFEDGRPVAAGEAVEPPLTSADVVRLRPYDGLRVRWPAGRDGVLETVLALAAAGVPVYADEVPAWVEEADAELAGLLTSWAPGPADPSVRSVRDLRREEHSVRLRRHAMRPPDPAPAVSVVMCSKRPHLLGSALAQIAGQRHVRAEVVLGLHGVPASRPEVAAAVEGFPLPLTVVEADAETPFGEVLRDVAGRASGDDLAKWDDDDWYSPEHLADLALARRHSEADIVGTAAEFFYLEPLELTVRRTDYTSEVFSDHVAGGTILVSREKYHEIGGFEGVTRGVDSTFLKSAHAAGARIYRAHGLGYVLRRSLAEDHTWRLPLAHFLRVATNQWRGFRPSRILEAS